jgi:hypothetical protein
MTVVCHPAGAGLKATSQYAGQRMNMLARNALNSPCGRSWPSAPGLAASLSEII